jgi:hypothetical protein
MSRELGSDERTTQNALSAALPFLMGALTRNASSTSGAESLTNALTKDHDGSILDNVSGFLGSADSGPGDGILKHLLGNKRPGVESAISQSSGMDLASVGKLLKMVAPLIMGGLGRVRQEKGLDAGGISDLLQGEMKTAEQSGGIPKGLLSLLDQDADGDVVDDLARLGKGMLGGLLGRK